MKNDSALTAMIRREHWDLFLTLTFKNPAPFTSVAATKKLFRQYLNALGETFRVPVSDMTWVLRVEFGGLNGRLHWHALLGGLPPRLVNRAAAYTSQFVWTEQMKLGISKNRVFNSARDGVSYITKGWQPSDAPNAYEAGKFDNTEYTTLFPAPSLVAKWRAEVEPNRRRRRARDMRNSSHVKTATGI